MRMRRKKNLDNRLEATKDLYSQEPIAFPTYEKIQLEVGTGKGDFIVKSAMKYPDIFFVGLEKEKGALVIALEKAKEKEVKNIFFIAQDARLLKDFFKEGQVDRIYLNFSDPWPKNKKEKMRLTHSDFLEIYKYILKDRGQIHQKTDNINLFNYSLRSFEKNNFKLISKTYDLHSSDFEDNIETEYERRFIKEGKKICRLVVEKNDKTKKEA